MWLSERGRIGEAGRRDLLPDSFANLGGNLAGVDAVRDVGRGAGQAVARRNGKTRRWFAGRYGWLQGSG